jgi:gliding motility-associated lipoprotein GldH
MYYRETGYPCDRKLSLIKISDLKKSLLTLLIPFLALSGCTLNTGVFEQNVAIPHHQWESSFKPSFSFTVRDTSSLYNVYFVMRHTDAYGFNNIWVRATVEQPGDSVARTQPYDLTLATNESGWIGSAMDDIYESRILIQPLTKFKKPGDYRFTLEQIMRQDPLLHVLNAGIRIEKAR